jgi:hypothetical protein
MTAERTESEFILPHAEFEPAYMALYRSGELHRRAADALNRLTHSWFARAIAAWTGWPTRPRHVIPAGTPR